MNEIALKLRTLMKERRISQEELGKKVGKSQSAVKHWLSHHGPPARLMPAIEAALEVPAGTLLKGPAKQTSPLAQELIALLQEGAFSEEELGALLKFSRVFARSQGMPTLGAGGLRPGLSVVTSRATVQPLRPGVGGVVSLYAPGFAAASNQGRDWFDTLDEPPEVRVAVDHLRWLGQPQKLDRGRHYVLMVEGDSMEPQIPRGALVVVAHSETPVASYPHVVAWQEGGEGRVAIKQLRQEGAGLVCMSLNPAHKPFMLGPEHQPQVRGFVVAVIEGDFRL